MNVLLIQIRQPSDMMASHEQACLERRAEGLKVRWKVRNVFAEEPRKEWLEGVSAMIVGGSGSYSVHDARSASWVGPLRDVMETALATALPSFGICFGHQLLGFHLGAQVRTKPELSEVGTIPLDATAAGLNDPVFGALGGSYCAHTGHSDSVIGIPTCVELLARSKTLETQVFKVKDVPFYSTQFHPDISGAEARLRYDAYQSTLVKSVPEARPQETARYRVGEDASNALIARFLKLAS
jgi:GMP synthase (glutamine-hydrolysing)